VYKIAPERLKKELNQRKNSYMKNIYLLIFILFIAICSGCRNNDESKNKIPAIDIIAHLENIQQINLSEIANEIRYVSLETRDDIFVSDMSKFYVSDKHIIATDMESLILFDRAGKFISKFGSKGRGPGEYQFISNLSIENEEMVFFNSVNDLFEFDTDGNFIKKYANILKVDEKYPIQNWRMINDSLLIGNVDNMTGKIEYKALIINKNGEIIRAFKNYDLLQSTGSRVYGGYARIFEFGNTIYFKELFNDTLFALDNEYELIPKFVFKLGDFGVPNSVRVKFPPITNDYLTISDIALTKNLMIMRVRLGDNLASTGPLSGNSTNAVCIFNKDSGELTFCKPSDEEEAIFPIGINNDLDGGPRFNPTKMVSDSIMVMSISAKQLREYVASQEFRMNKAKYMERKQDIIELANSLTDYDNPVLMFVRFK
jgi:hypothetical protein